MADNQRKWHKPQLQNAISMRTDEHHTWITIFLTSLTTNVILIITLLRTGELPTQGPGIIICALGFSISLMLFYIQERALGSMKSHEDRITEIEDELGYKDSTKNIQPASFGARRLMVLFGVLQILGWGIGIICFLLWDQSSCCFH